jgi:hypothetical protein
MRVAARIFPAPCSKSRATVEREKTLTNQCGFFSAHLFIADAALLRLPGAHRSKPNRMMCVQLVPME